MTTAVSATHAPQTAAPCSSASDQISTQDQRVYDVAMQNLPVAEVVGEPRVNFSDLRDGGNEELVSRVAHLVLEDENSVPTVTRLESTDEDLPVGEQAFSREFVHRLTARDPYFEEGVATQSQIDGDRTKLREHLESSQQLRQERYTMIKYILRVAKNDGHAKRLLVNMGYSYETVAAMTSPSDPVIFRLKAVPRTHFRGRAFSPPELVKARATRQLAKAVQSKEEIRQILVAKAKEQHPDKAHQIG